MDPLCPIPHSGGLQWTCLALLITMKSHGDFPRHTLCRPSELSFPAREEQCVAFFPGELVQISTIIWAGIITITGVKLLFATQSSWMRFWVLGCIQSRLFFLPDLSC